MNWRSEQICSQEADGTFGKRFAVWPTIFGLKRKAGAMSSKNSRGEAEQLRVEWSVAKCPALGKELTGAALAPKNSETLRELQRRRPQDQMSEIPRDVLEFQTAAPFQLDESLFCVLFEVRTFRLFARTKWVHE